MLQEENESVLEKVKLQALVCSVMKPLVLCGNSINLFLNLDWQLRLAEERCEEAEARAKELEKQVR